MPAKIPTASWVRVRLTSPATDGPSLTSGELVLRADSIDHQADALVFLLAGEEVFRLERKYYQSSAWFVDRPTFADWLKARRAKHPMQHRPWTGAEMFQLRQEIADGVTWERIAVLHKRTVGAVQAKAAKAKSEATL